MKTALFGVIISCICIAAFSSCEALFSTNLLSGAQRDPSSLSQEQKVTYAQDALASGDEASMKKAYDALSGTTDNSLKPLVAELALGAAGVTGAMTSAMSDFISGNTPSDFESAIGGVLAQFSSVDLGLISSASALISQSEAAGTVPTADQYFVIGVGLLVSAAKQWTDLSQPITTCTPADLTAFGAPAAPALSALNSGLGFLTTAAAAFPAGSQAASIVNQLRDAFNL